MLFELSLLKNLRTKGLSLDRLTIYSAQSLIPRDAMTGGLSGRFKLAIAPEYNAQMQQRRSVSISGAVGFDLRPLRDVDIYALIGGGLAYSDKRARVFAEPEIGLIAREIFDMKSMLSVSRRSDIAGDRSAYVRWSFTQSKYFESQKFSVHLRVSRDAHRGKQVGQAELGVKKILARQLN